METPITPTPEEPKRNNTTLIVIVVIVLAMCCCCLISIPIFRWLWFNGDSLFGARLLLQALL